jgi:hypothetical protein
MFLYADLKIFVSLLSSWFWPIFFTLVTLWIFHLHGENEMNKVVMINVDHLTTSSECTPHEDRIHGVFVEFPIFF